MTTLRLAVVGSRDWSDAARITSYLDRLPDAVTLVSGGARGVDSIAENYARARGWDVMIIPADWTQGRGAGIARNADIVANADAVVAFWDGKSKGTKNTIDRALAASHIRQVVVFKASDNAPGGAL